MVMVEDVKSAVVNVNKLLINGCSFAEGERSHSPMEESSLKI